MCVQVRFVVLDEADQMLDMGFEEDMEVILQQVSPRLAVVAKPAAAAGEPAVGDQQDRQLKAGSKCLVTVCRIAVKSRSCCAAARLLDVCLGLCYTRGDPSHLIM